MPAQQHARPSTAANVGAMPGSAAALAAQTAGEEHQVSELTYMIQSRAAAELMACAPAHLGGAFNSIVVTAANAAAAVFAVALMACYTAATASPTGAAPSQGDAGSGGVAHPAQLLPGRLPHTGEHAAPQPGGSAPTGGR